jgi:integrase
MRGDGWLRCRGGVYYAVFYHRGRKVRQSLKTGDKDIAERRLVALRRKRERGEYQPAAERRVTVAELLDDLIVHLEVQGRSSARKVKGQAKAIKEELGHVAAADLETARVERVAQVWLRDGKARGTVDLRLRWLRRAFRLAVNRTPPKIRAVPYIPSLTVDNARQGFFEPADLERLLRHLEPDLADYVEWGWWTGMRRSESSALTWAMLDRSGPRWELRIPGPITKNREGRTLPLVGSSREVIERRLRARRLPCALIFHRAGRPVKTFVTAWRAALKAAGLPKERLYHDLRRSAARNLRRAGASETEAMRVTGHKSSSMFRRYSIVTDDDAASAMLKVDGMLRKK